jgi:mannosyltransferase OCH1-like enzyme
MDEKTPRIIWQTWKTKDFKKLPKKFMAYSREWRRLHPTFEYHLLDDDDLRNTVSKVVPQYLDKYDNFTATIERVDFARYALLYDKGGVYADLDIHPLKNIGRWVDMDKIVLGCEPSIHATQNYGRDRVLCNAIMISPPHQEYWLKLMDFIIDHYEHYQNPVYTTGPMAMTALYEKNPSLHNDMIITEPCIFYPMLGDGKMAEECLGKESYVVHVWENTWVPKGVFSDVRWKNKRCWFFGLLGVIFASYFVYVILFNSRNE